MASYLYNAHVLLPDYTFKYGGVEIENGRISRVFGAEEQAQLKRSGALTSAEDCRGGAIIPGLKNCHTHSAMTLLRGYAEGLPLKEWLFNKVFPFEAHLTAEDVYYGTKLAIMEYLAGGVTQIVEMYKHDDAYMKACADCGFRVIGVGAVSDINGNTEAQLELVERLYNQYKTENQGYVLGYHAEYTCSDRLLEGVAALSRKYRAPVYAHVSETAQEVSSCTKRRGKTPFAFAADLGLFDNGGAIFHGVHLTSEEVSLARDKKVAVVINRGSNLKLKSGIAPVSDYLRAGLTLALGTDGPASNNALDMFRELYLFAALEDSTLTAEDALRALIGGGNAVTGSRAIEQGARADLAVVSLSRANMRPCIDIASSLVYSAAAANVYLTMIGGKTLYKNGKYYLSDKPEYIYKKCESIHKRIISGLSR